MKKIKVIAALAVSVCAVSLLTKQVQAEETYHVTINAIGRVINTDGSKTNIQLDSVERDLPEGSSPAPFGDFKGYAAKSKQIFVSSGMGNNAVYTQYYDAAPALPTVKYRLVQNDGLVANDDLLPMTKFSNGTIGGKYNVEELGELQLAGYKLLNPDDTQGAISSLDQVILLKYQSLTQQPDTPTKFDDTDKTKNDSDNQPEDQSTDTGTSSEDENTATSEETSETAGTQTDEVKSSESGSQTETIQPIETTDDSTETSEVKTVETNDEGAQTDDTKPVETSEGSTQTEESKSVEISDKSTQTEAVESKETVDEDSQTDEPVSAKSQDESVQTDDDLSQESKKEKDQLKDDKADIKTPDKKRLEIRSELDQSTIRKVTPEEGTTDLKKSDSAEVTPKENDDQNHDKMEKSASDDQDSVEDSDSEVDDSSKPTSKQKPAAKLPQTDEKDTHHVGAAIGMVGLLLSIFGGFTHWKQKWA